MYEHVLVAVAMEETHDTANAIGIARALRREGGAITALHVVEEMPPGVIPHLPRDFVESHHRELAQKLEDATGHADDVRHALIDGHSSTTIIDYAAEHGVDCIVISSHRPGLQDYFLGSTAARVVRHAPCAVHVIR